MGACSRPKDGPKKEMMLDLADDRANVIGAAKESPNHISPETRCRPAEIDRFPGGERRCG
jgi:hypothetical protein